MLSDAAPSPYPGAGGGQPEWDSAEPPSSYAEAAPELSPLEMWGLQPLPLPPEGHHLLAPAGQHMSPRSIEAEYEALAQKNEIMRKHCYALAAGHEDLAEHHRQRGDLAHVFGAKADPDRYRKLIEQYESMHNRYEGLQGEYERLAGYYRGDTPHRKAVEKLQSDCDSARRDTLTSVEDYRGKLSRITEKKSSSILSHLDWTANHEATAHKWRKKGDDHATWWKHEAWRIGHPRLLRARLAEEAGRARARRYGADSPSAGGAISGRSGPRGESKPGRGACGSGSRTAGRSGGIQRVNAEGVKQALTTLRRSQNKLQAQTDQLSNLQRKFNAVSKGSAAKGVTEAVARVINHRQSINQSIGQVVKATEKYVGNMLKIDSARFLI